MLVGLLTSPLRLTGEGVLEVEGPGTFQEETSHLSYPARA